MNCVLSENVKWWLVATAVLLLVAGAIVKLSINQKMRTAAALFCLLCLPSACMILVLFVVKESKQAASIWIGLSVFQIGVCLMLAKQHLLQIKKDANEYFVVLFDLNNDKECEFSVEGESSFVVIVWGIYGLAALLGSVFIYFAIAEAWKPETFIFKNNEGFIAALALLIIVISGAAVPIYNDLAKQVRQQIETFQLQISELNRAVTNINQHASPLWMHFEKVSRAAVRTWSKRLNRHIVGQASYDLLLKPFVIMKNGKLDNGFDQISDENLLPYQASFVPFGSERILGELTGFKKSYLATPDLERSKKRIRENSMFKSMKPAVDKVKEKELSTYDRRQRSRRLRYLGWLAQGELAIAFSKSTQGHPIWFAPTKYSELPLLNFSSTQLKSLKLDSKSENFQGFSSCLVPATEDWMVAVLNVNSGEQTDSTEQFAGEFQRRADRHLKFWNEVTSAKLVAICDPLDLDIAVFADDMYLLEQLAMPYKKVSPVAVNARFLYYGFWLNAVTEPKTKIFEILQKLVVAGPNSTASAEQEGSSDVREELNKIRELVAPFVGEKDEADASPDPISKHQPYLSRSPTLQFLIHWNLLVNYLHFSPKWTSEVRSKRPHQAWLVAQIVSQLSDTQPELVTLSEKQKKFLCWLVTVLGDVIEKKEIESKRDDELLILAFRLVSPYFKHQYQEIFKPEGERRPLSDEDSETQFREIIKKVGDYCMDKQHAIQLQKAFFGGGDSATTAQATENYEKWVEAFSQREVTKPPSQNLTEEFLILTLADHKSALFNWLRAARSVETRQRVQAFQNRLESQLLKTPKQLGIEVVPSRHDCLIYLREYLEVAGHQKSMRLRSLYDLVPTTAEDVARKSDNEFTIYRSYVEIIKYLRISQSLRDDVGLSKQIHTWLVAQIVPQLSDTQPELVTLSEKQKKFLCWLVTVLGDVIEKKEIESKRDDELLILVFRLVSPYFKHQHEEMGKLEGERRPLSDEDSETQFREIIKKVGDYCMDKQHAIQLQIAFFGGGDSAQKAQAPENYEKWVEAFTESHKTEQADNDNQ